MNQGHTGHGCRGKLLGHQGQRGGSGQECDRMTAGGAGAAAAAGAMPWGVGRHIALFGIAVAVMRLSQALMKRAGLKMDTEHRVRGLSGRQRRGTHARRQALGGMALQRQGQGQHPCQCNPPDSTHARRATRKKGALPRSPRQARRRLHTVRLPPMGRSSLRLWRTRPAPRRDRARRHAHPSGGERPRRRRPECGPPCHPGTSARPCAA